MGCDPKRVTEVALAEVGYLEKASNDQLDDKTANAGDKNRTKYARDLDALGFYNGKKQGVYWCDVFADWCYVKAYGLDAALKLTCQPLGKNNCGAGCKYSRNYYKKNKRLFDSPEIGDQIFFWPKDAIGGPAVQHTGVVYNTDDTYVYTVEGNTTGANGVIANGGGVCKKKYKRTYNRIAGYGRPDWNAVEGEVQMATVETEASTPTVRQIRITGTRVAMRRGDSTKATLVGRLNTGATLDWVATSENGWHAGRNGKEIVWISGDYSTVEG